MIQTNPIMEPLSYYPHVPRAETTGDTHQGRSRLLRVRQAQVEVSVKHIYMIKQQHEFVPVILDSHGAIREQPTCKESSC